MWQREEIQEVLCFASLGLGCCGSFTQLAISSIADKLQASPRDLIEDVQGYGPDLVDLEPRHSPDTLQRRRDVLAAERPFIEHFEYANAWGHALMRVQADQVQASVYRGLADVAWTSLNVWRTT